MYLKNERLSKRQIFRIGMLENIPLGIVVIPYITTNVAGKNHMWAFLLGIAFVCVYGIIMYVYTKMMPYGLMETIDRNMGRMGVVFDLLYSLRFVIKASLVIFYFGGIIKEYMLRSYNLWLIIVPFIFICSYGAISGIEKRGRLLEFLFWWMIVPLILVAVFSVSNVEWSNFTAEFFHGVVRENVKGGSIGEVCTAAYMVLLVLQTFELMQFTLCFQRKNEWQNALKLLIWVVIAMTLSYVLIIGILGEDWVSISSREAFSVIQASAFPGGLIERLDYPVLTFWIIGIFAIVSGYMFYAKEFLNRAWKDNIKTYKRWGLIIVLLAVLGETILISLNDTVLKWMFYYVFYADILVSLIVPLIVYGAKKIKVCMLLCFTLIISMCVVGCRNSKEKSMNLNESIENRDYATCLNISYDEQVLFIVQVADLSGHEGNSLGVPETKAFEYKANGISDIQRSYYEENGRQLDLGHLEYITMEHLPEEEEKRIVDEMREMPEIAKSVLVVRNDEEKIILRKLIKNLLNRESF